MWYQTPGFPSDLFLCPSFASAPPISWPRDHPTSRCLHHNLLLPCRRLPTCDPWLPRTRSCTPQLPAAAALRVILRSPTHALSPARTRRPPSHAHLCARFSSPSRAAPAHAQQIWACGPHCSTHVLHMPVHLPRLRIPLLRQLGSVSACVWACSSAQDVHRVHRLLCHHQYPGEYSCGPIIATPYVTIAAPLSYSCCPRTETSQLTQVGAFLQFPAGKVWPWWPHGQDCTSQTQWSSVKHGRFLHPQLPSWPQV